MAHQIRPGQTYIACHPGDVDQNGERRLIRIVSVDTWSYTVVVTVVTVLADGRETRSRNLEARHLHASAVTAAGQPRRTGYALDQPTP